LIEEYGNYNHWEISDKMTYDKRFRYILPVSNQNEVSETRITHSAKSDLL